VARRLRRRSGRPRHHLAIHGRRWLGASLWRRLQSLLRGRHATEVDVRARHGLADRLEGLESHYAEAEKRIGVSGEASPLKDDWRSQPLPDAADDDDLQLIQLKAWAEKSGIPFWTTPQAKNTVDGLRRPQAGATAATRAKVCPTGRALLARPLRTSSCWRRRRSSCTTARSSASWCSMTTTPRVVGRARGEGRWVGLERRVSRERTFVVASGLTCWSSHLLLLSANARFPNGLANTSDHVGRYMTGHLGA